jgi:hypothetical protein
MLDLNYDEQQTIDEEIEACRDVLQLHVDHDHTRDDILRFALRGAPGLNEANIDRALRALNAVQQELDDDEPLYIAGEAHRELLVTVRGLLYPEEEV